MNTIIANRSKAWAFIKRWAMPFAAGSLLGYLWISLMIMLLPFILIGMGFAIGAGMVYVAFWCSVRFLGWVLP